MTTDDGLERFEIVRDKARPFGGLSPAEAARRKAELAREKREAREADATWNALTVQQRFAKVAARTFTEERFEELLEQMVRDAMGARRNTERRLLLEALKLASAGNPEDEADTADLDAASPAKRAALRAELDAFLAAQGGPDKPGGGAGQAESAANGGVA